MHISFCLTYCSRISIQSSNVERKSFLDSCLVSNRTRIVLAQETSCGSDIKDVVTNSSFSSTRCFVLYNVVLLFLYLQ